jgi:hypothetical protein
VCIGKTHKVKLVWALEEFKFASANPLDRRWWQATISPLRRYLASCSQVVGGKDKELDFFIELCESGKSGFHI